MGSKTASRALAIPHSSAGSSFGEHGASSQLGAEPSSNPSGNGKEDSMGTQEGHMEYVQLKKPEEASGLEGRSGERDCTSPGGRLVCVCFQIEDYYRISV